MAAGDKSFCVGPHFTLRPKMAKDAYDVTCRGQDVGRVFSSGGEVVASVQGKVIGRYPSWRQAGVAVLKEAGVRGDLEAK